MFLFYYNGGWKTSPLWRPKGLDISETFGYNTSAG